MGGERYRFVELRQGCNPTQEEQRAFSALRPELLKIVEEWWSGLAPEEKKGWQCTLPASASPLLLHPPDKTRLFTTSCLPLLLDSSLSLGWQDRHYGSELDPSRPVTDRMMDLVLGCKDLRSCVEEEEEDCIADDLYGGAEDLYDRPDSDHSLDSRDFTACGSDCGWCGHCDYD